MRVTVYKIFRDYRRKISSASNCKETYAPRARNFSSRLKVLLLASKLSAYLGKMGRRKSWSRGASVWPATSCEARRHTSRLLPTRGRVKIFIRRVLSPPSSLPFSLHVPLYPSVSIPQKTIEIASPRLVAWCNR